MIGIAEYVLIFKVLIVSFPQINLLLIIYLKLHSSGWEGKRIVKMLNISLLISCIRFYFRCRQRCAARRLLYAV